MAPKTEKTALERLREAAAKQGVTVIEVAPRPGFGELVVRFDKDSRVMTGP